MLMKDEFGGKIRTKLVALRPWDQKCIATSKIIVMKIKSKEKVQSSVK